MPTEPRRAAVLLLASLWWIATAGPAHAESPSSLTVSPGSGEYPASHRFDLVLVLRGPVVGLLGGQATLDDVDVTGPLTACARIGSLETGGLTIRCPGLVAGALGLGTHTFQATLFLSDGSIVEGGAVWEVLAD